MMMLHKGHAIILVALLSGCGVFETHKEKDGEPSAVESLRERHAAWLSELAAVSAEDSGWPSVSDCDSLLWAGLAKASGAKVMLELAEHSPGVLHRRPVPCWTPEAGDQGSKSTISRDMLTGYLWGQWATGDVAALQRLADYGSANEWIMGMPWPEQASRVEMGDNLKGVLCRAIRALTNGADERKVCGSAMPLYLPVFQDYERHIQTLGILLQGEVDRALRAGDATAPEPDSHPEKPLELTAIDGEMLKRLQEHVEAYPADALFQAALARYSGQYGEAIRLLEDDGYQAPSYVRGSDVYPLVHKAFAASVILKHHAGLQ